MWGHLVCVCWCVCPHWMLLMCTLCVCACVCAHIWMQMLCVGHRRAKKTFCPSEKHYSGHLSHFGCRVRFANVSVNVWLQLFIVRNVSIIIREKGKWLMPHTFLKLKTLYTCIHTYIIVIRNIQYILITVRTTVRCLCLHPVELVC